MPDYKDVRYFANLFVEHYKTKHGMSVSQILLYPPTVENPRYTWVCHLCGIDYIVDGGEEV
jgi:hypothetical protein